MATKPTESIDHTARSNSVSGAASEPVVATRAALTPEEMAAGSIGAQIILDYNSPGSLGARGGAAATMEENVAAYDGHMVALGLDPLAPSGPPSGPEVLKDTGGVVGKATKISSLAAGLLSIANIPDGSVPPVNVDVPSVSQSGATLLCTMGTWDGEPTAYAYQWQFDGADVASDGETCPVVTADAGKMATCVVSATNAAGTTAAPPSVGVTITDPGAAGTRRGK